MFTISHVAYIITQLDNGDRDGKVPGKTLEMNKQEFKNFESMLKKGGWNEQSTFR
jgi:hypothetical protein